MSNRTRKKMTIAPLPPRPSLLNVAATPESKIPFADLAGKGTQAPEMRLIRVTPQWAAAVLERRDKNRHLIRANVERFCAALKEGKYRNVGDPIRFDREERLIDGQHRLTACVETGIPFDVYVATGMEADDYHLIDGGVSRKASDDLSYEGVMDASRVSAALNLIVRYERNIMKSPGRKITRHEVNDVYKTHSDVSESVSVSHSSRTVVNTTVMAAAHYICSRIDRGMADDMAAAISHGVDLQQGNPYLVARNRLIRDRSAIKKLDDTHRLAYIILAWNAVRKGRTVSDRGLAWSPEDEFPTAI